MVLACAGSDRPVPSPHGEVSTASSQRSRSLCDVGHGNENVDESVRGSATGSRGIFESRASEAGGSDGLAFGELDGVLGSEVIVTRLPGFEAGHAALDITAAWQRLSAGAGAKGHRVYQWALIDTTDPAAAQRVGCHWLLIRRNIRR